MKTSIAYHKKYGFAYLRNKNLTQTADSTEFQYRSCCPALQCDVQPFEWTAEAHILTQAH